MRPPCTTTAQLKSRLSTTQRQADDGDDRELARRGDDPPERLASAVEQRALVEEVVAGVGRQAELGEEREDGAPAPPPRASSAIVCVGVERRVGHAHLRDADRDAREVVAVEIEE